MSQIEKELNHIETASDSISQAHYFSHLIAGNFYPDSESLLDDAHRLCIDIEAKRYVLIAMKVEKWGDTFAKPDGKVDVGAIRHIFFIIKNVTDDIFAKFGKVFGAEFMGMHLCLIGLDDDIEKPIPVLKEAAYQALEFLESTFNLSATAAISQIYDDVMSLPNTMNDTAGVFNYIDSYEEDTQVAAFLDFSQESNPMNESDYLEMESKLLSCVRASDFDGARRVVHDMAAKELFIIRPSIQILQFRVNGLVNTLLHMTETLKQTIGDEAYMELNPGSRLCDAGSISVILENVDEIFDWLQEFSEEKKKDSPPPWVSLVREYVDDNYRDFNLTVSSVSDKFNISPSYCSRIFKQYSGLGLFEYIQRCRLEAAKALMNTNMSVKSIAEDVGFSSSLTMNRAFKRYEGTTPSKFKEI